MKSDGLREIMKFAQRVEERNLWSQSDKGDRGGGVPIAPKFGVGLTHQTHPYGMARGGGSCDPLASWPTLNSFPDPTFRLGLDGCYSPRATPQRP